MTDWRDHIFYEDKWVVLLVGDVREILPLLPAEICQSAITSPPYFGLEPSVDEFVCGKEREPEKQGSFAHSAYGGEKIVE